MYDFIKSKINSNITKELETPVLWNTVLKEYKAHLKTDKPVVLLSNNLPSEFDKEIIHGLAKCMDFGFSSDITWIRTIGDFFAVLEHAINENKTYVGFSSEDLLREFDKKIYFSQLCHVARMEFDREDLEELMIHFGQNGTSTPEEKFTVGELFLTFFLLSIVESDYELIPRLVKNVQYEILDNHLLLVPTTEILREYVIDLKNETIMRILSFDSYLLQYFIFYETIQTTYDLQTLPPFSRMTLVNLLVSKIIVDKLAGSMSLERLKNLAKFYDLEYFKELERITRSIEYPPSGYSYAKSDIATGLSSLIQEKIDMISYAFHGLEHEFTPQERIERDLLTEDFYSTQKLALLDPIFIKFSDFKLNDDVMNTVVETQIKQIKDTNLQLDEKLFHEKSARKNNDTKLISIIGNLIYFNSLERIYGQVMVSQQIKERFLGFFSRIEAQFFSLDESILRNFERRMAIANIFDSSQISFLDEFLRKIISNLSQVLEGTAFVNDLIDLKKGELFVKFLELYQRNLLEFKESAKPKNIRKWAIISFFYDYATDYLIETYPEKRDKNITHIIDQIIDYGHKNGFEHTILLVIDGLSYVHWELIKSNLIEKVKTIADLKLDEFRLGPILSRTPVGHSALFSGLLPLENGVYSDILRFQDTYINLMQPKWSGESINPNYLNTTEIVKTKISQNLFNSKHSRSGNFYYFTLDVDSPMTLLFGNFLGTNASPPQTKLAKRVAEEKEELKLSEEEAKIIANFVHQLEDKELKDRISVVQYPDIDRVMHFSGWNFKFYLDEVETQLKHLIEAIHEKKLGERILVAITSDHGSISKAETSIVTNLLPFKFTMEDFNSLTGKIPSFDKETNRFSYSYLQVFDDSQIAAINSFIKKDIKALKVLVGEEVHAKMGKSELKGLKYPKAFVIPKYIMHFTKDSILRHGSCSLNEILIPFVLIEVRK